MTTHVKVVAVLFIVLGILGILGALTVGAVFGIAGIAGAAAADEAPFALPIIGITGGLFTAFLLIVSVPGLVAGFGLLSFKPWARILAIVLLALQLVNIPIGTIFGLYGLWVMLNSETESLFARSA